MSLKNKEAHRAYMKKWHSRNRVSQKEYMAEYAALNREKLTNYTRQYRTNSPWLISYMGAKQRCENKNNHNYSRYGGRGIRFLLNKSNVKSLWFRDKASQMKWPTLDRINNDGDYEYCNCRFVEMSFNSSRKKNAHLV